MSGLVGNSRRHVLSCPGSNKDKRLKGPTAFRANIPLTKRVQSNKGNTNKCAFAVLGPVSSNSFRRANFVNLM